MNLVAAYGLLAHGLLFGAATALLPLGQLRARVALAATTLALIVGIAPAMHAFFGAPSATLIVLAMLQLADKTPSPFGQRPAIGLLVFALPFYAMSLGLGSFDPYATGYHPASLLGVLLVLGLALWWRRAYLWLIILAADLAAYALGIFTNLWDALFDPLLVLIALIIALRPVFSLWIAGRERKKA